jgi:hypothetical protein
MSVNPRLKMGNLKKIKKVTDTVFEAVSDMDIGDTIFGCAAVLAVCLNEIGNPDDRAMIRDRIIAMLHAADDPAIMKNGTR